MATPQADEAASALLSVLPANGGSVHVYDLFRWWEAKGFERLHGDLDLFITARTQTFRYQGGLVARLQRGGTGGNPSSYARVHDTEKRRRESEWNSIRHDLHVTTVRLSAAANARSSSASAEQVTPRSSPPLLPSSAAAADVPAAMESGVSINIPRVTRATAPNEAPAQHPGSSLHSAEDGVLPPPPRPSEAGPPAPALSPRKLWERPVGALPDMPPSDTPPTARRVDLDADASAAASAAPAAPPPPHDAPTTPRQHQHHHHHQQRHPVKRPSTPDLHPGRLHSPVASPVRGGGAGGAAMDPHALLPAINTGVFVAATAGVLASLRLIKERKTPPPHEPPSEVQVARELIGCALESVVELVGRDALDGYMREWLAASAAQQQQPGEGYPHHPHPHHHHHHHHHHQPPPRDTQAMPTPPRGGISPQQQHHHRGGAPVVVGHPAAEGWSPATPQQHHHPPHHHPHRPHSPGGPRSPQGDASAVAGQGRGEGWNGYQRQQQMQHQQRHALQAQAQSPPAGGQQMQQQQQQQHPLSVEYTPHVEYAGVLHLISTQRGRRAWSNAAAVGDVTVGASSVCLGSASDVVENSPRPFSTDREPSPWIGLQLEGVRVRPTHYTVGYHPGSGVPPPTSWQLEGLVEVEGGGGASHWVVLSLHASDSSFLPGTTEVVASFMLQPTSLFFASFRLALCPGKADEALPFSALELYGTVEPV